MTIHTDAAFYIGGEANHTPAFSKKTLFVVGVQPIEQISSLAADNKVPHIYLTANQSYSDDNVAYYNSTASNLIAAGYLVTLEYPVQSHSLLLQKLLPTIWQSKAFIAVVNCKIPAVTTCNPNLTVKLDDGEIGGSNGGVWCWNQHAICDSNRFTSWGDYDSYVDIATTLTASLTFDDVKTEVIGVVKKAAESVVTEVKADTAEIVKTAATDAIEGKPQAIVGDVEGELVVDAVKVVGEIITNVIAGDAPQDTVTAPITESIEEPVQQKSTKAKK